jgi:hypothetical protein
MYLTGLAARAPFRPVLQSISQSTPGNARVLPWQQRDITTLRGFPHLSGPQHEDLSTPGYAFTSSAWIHCCSLTPNPRCAYV